MDDTTNLFWCFAKVDMLSHDHVSRDELEDIKNFMVSILIKSNPTHILTKDIDDYDTISYPSSIQPLNKLIREPIPCDEPLD